MSEREKTLINDLKKIFQALDEAVITLEFSLAKSKKIFEKHHNLSQMNLDELDALEALCSRFSRVSDILVKEVFRMIDLLEIKEEGSAIDILNRAEKRGIIDSSPEFRDLRATRNKISHEYTKEELEDIFLEVMKYTPKLLLAYKKTKEYFTDLVKKLG